jgi:hypothetical protein
LADPNIYRFAGNPTVATMNEATRKALANLIQSWIINIRDWIAKGYIESEVGEETIKRIARYPDEPARWERACRQLEAVADYKSGRIKLDTFNTTWKMLERPEPGAARVTKPDDIAIKPEPIFEFPPDMPANYAMPLRQPQRLKEPAIFRGGIGALPRSKSLSDKSDKEIDELLNELAALLAQTLPTGPNNKTKTSHFVLMIYDNEKQTQIVSNLTQQELEKFMGQAQSTYKPKKPKVTRKIELED